MQSLRTTCPHFSSLGVLSASALQYTVQKHEVFNGLLPQCVRIVKVLWCLERRAFAFDLATHSTLKLNMKIYTVKGGIHSLFVKWRSNFHAKLANWFILRSVTESKNGTFERISRLSWDNSKPSLLCLLKNDYDYQKQLPSWKKNNQSFE